MTEQTSRPTLAQLKEQPHYSYSALNTYLNVCQLQYFYRYVEKAESEQTAAALPFGSAFHATLSEIAHAAKRGEATLADKAMEAFAAYFDAALADSANVIYKDGQDRNALTELAGRMLSEATREWPDWFGTVAGVAVPFSMDIGLSKPVIGECDLVLKEPGPFDEEGDEPQATIVDWKTSSRMWPADRADREMQATVYTAAYQRAHRQTPWFRYDVVTKTRTPKVARFHTTRSGDQITRMERLLQEADRAIQTGVFLPSETSFACGDCPYAGACKAWHRDACRTVSVPTESTTSKAA